MLSVCFAGITGWTAPPIVAAIDAADDLTLTSGSVPFRGRPDFGRGDSVKSAEERWRLCHRL
jgi:hypothetical protein